MGLINHLTQDGNYVKYSIRKLLYRAGDAIRELKPFFMMFFVARFFATLRD